jgi:excisionase family DNA binding protein
MANALLLNPEEAAEILGMSRSSIYKLITAGEIQSVKIGRSRRILTSALEKFVESLPVDEIRMEEQSQ